MLPRRIKEYRTITQFDQKKFFLSGNMADQRAIKKFMDFMVPSYGDDEDDESTVYQTIKSITKTSRELKCNFATIFSSTAGATTWQIYPIMDVGRIELNQGTGNNQAIGNVRRLQGLEVFFRTYSNGVQGRGLTRYIIGICPKIPDPGGGVPGLNSYLQGKLFNTNSITATRNVTNIDEFKILYEFFTTTTVGGGQYYETGMNPVRHVYVKLHDTAITRLGVQFSVIENFQLYIGACSDAALHNYSVDAALYYTD